MKKLSSNIRLCHTVRKVLELNKNENFHESLTNCFVEIIHGGLKWI